MKEKIRKLLADFLGVDPEDIKDEDILAEDLHMGPTEVTDFLQSLDPKEFDTESFDMEEVETFEDLAEKLYDKHPNP